MRYTLITNSVERQKMRKSLHPVQWLAAGAVTIFCLTGTAAFLGWLPGSAANAPEQLVTNTDDAVEGDKTVIDNVMPSDTPPALAEAEPAPAPPVVAKKPAAKVVAPREVVMAPVAAPQPVRNLCADCGTVVRVETVQQRGKGSGVGAVAGGVVGGILGNQVGKGTGRDLATIAGAVIGGVAGHNVERNITPRVRYRTTVRLEDGQMHSFTQDAPPAWGPGDQIQVPFETTEAAPAGASRSGIYENDAARF